MLSSLSSIPRGAPPVLPPPHPEASCRRRCHPSAQKGKGREGEGLPVKAMCAWDRVGWVSHGAPEPMLSHLMAGRFYFFSREREREREGENTRVGEIGREIERENPKEIPH